MHHTQLNSLCFVYRIIVVWVWCIGLSIFSPVQAAISSHDCMQLYQGEKEDSPRTSDTLDSGSNLNERLAKYVALTIAEGSLTESDADRFLSALMHGDFNNPVNRTSSQFGVLFEDVKHQIYYEGFERLRRELLENSAAIDLALVKKFLGEELHKDKVWRERRDETNRETANIHMKETFFRVPAGKFSPRETLYESLITLTHDIEVMSTPVTQYQWAMRMGANPAMFTRGDMVQIKLIADKQIRMLPDHPVESITWWSAIIFANRKSQEVGLPPVYDVSAIEFKSGTSAEEGTLAAMDEKLALSALKIDAPDGNIYKAQGFRLPTLAEQKYLMALFAGNDQEILKYAWVSTADKMLESTQPVAELSGHQLEIGKRFYDIFGNVAEWSHDRDDRDSNAAPLDIWGQNGVDPQLTAGTRLFTSGANWRSSHETVLQPLSMAPNSGSETVGLRLVRSLLE